MLNHNESTATSESEHTDRADRPPRTQRHLPLDTPGVASCAGVFANEMLPAGCCRLSLGKQVKGRTIVERLAAPQGFEPRYADPELFR
jgi:hypothetical protein